MSTQVKDAIQLMQQAIDSRPELLLTNRTDFHWVDSRYMRDRQGSFLWCLHTTGTILLDLSWKPDNSMVEVVQEDQRSIGELPHQWFYLEINPRPSLTPVTPEMAVAVAEQIDKRHCKT